MPCSKCERVCLPSLGFYFPHLASTSPASLQMLPDVAGVFSPATTQCLAPDASGSASPHSASTSLTWLLPPLRHCKCCQMCRGLFTCHHPMPCSRCKQVCLPCIAANTPQCAWSFCQCQSQQKRPFHHHQHLPPSQPIQLKTQAGGCILLSTSTSISLLELVGAVSGVDSLELSIYCTA